MGGFGRITDSFVGFPAVASAFRTKEAQAKVLVKTAKSCKAALKKLQLDKLPAASQPLARRVVCYLFTMAQEAFNSFGRKEIDGKGTKIFQELLISIGFPKVASSMFDQWLEVQVEAASKAAAAAEEAEKGDKKDDKKKGDKKGDKKDDKKDDK